MEPNLKAFVALKNAMILKGQIVEATEQYFADDVVTTDFDGTRTVGKGAVVTKVQDFTAAVASISEITLHKAAVNRDVSFAEFTFKFDMKDGSHIFRHEIIRSIWRNGKVVNEQYFKA